MAFVNPFHLLVFVVHLLENGSSCESSHTETICAFKTTSKNNPTLICFLLDLNWSSESFLPLIGANCGYNYRYSACNEKSVDLCSFHTNCCLRNGWNFQYEWPRSLSPLPYNCLRKPRCHIHANVSIDNQFFPRPDVYNCFASYHCVSAEVPSTKTVLSTAPSTTKINFSTSEKPATVSTEFPATLSETTLSDQTKEISSGIGKRLESEISTKTYTDVSDPYSLPVAAIALPIVLMGLAVGAGILLLLWKRRSYGRRKGLKSSNETGNFKRESNQYETISAHPKFSSRHTETRGLQSTKATACASGVQNNRECNDDKEAVGNQGYSCNIPEENNQCSYLNSSDWLQQGLQRSKERLTSFYEYRNKNFLKTRIENDEKQIGLKILNPGNLVENGKFCPYSSIQDVPCLEVVVENNPNTGYKNLNMEEFEKENHPYFILEPQGNEHSQVPTRHVETSAASENEYNRIRFTKANAILDDNYEIVSYYSLEFPVNTDEVYSHLGDTEIFRNAMDYSHIRVEKQGKSDEKDDYCNLYIKH